MSPAALVFSQQETSPQVEVISYVNKQTVVIGEPVHYTIKLTTDLNIEALFPQSPERLGNFQIKDSRFFSKDSFGKKTRMQRYELAAYELGEQTIPPVAVKFRVYGSREWSEALSNEVPVRVESIFGNVGGITDIRDIESPISFAWSYRRHAVIGLLIFIFAGFVVHAYLKRRRRLLWIMEQGLPADQLMYQRLSTLIESVSHEKHMTTPRFLEMGTFARQYLEARLRLKTIQGPREDFLIEVERFKPLAEKYGDSLKGLLKTCDMVKFANYEVSPEEFRSNQAWLKDLLRRLRPEPKE